MATRVLSVRVNYGVVTKYTITNIEVIALSGTII